MIKEKNIIKRAWIGIKDGLYFLNRVISNFIKRVVFKNRPTNPKTVKFKSKLFIFLMLVIPILHFCIFWIYVNFNSILLAFQKRNDANDIYYTLDHFRTVFQLFQSETTEMTLALKNTLITWCFGTFIMFPLSLFWAYFIYKKIVLGKFFRIVFYVPSIVSGVAVAAIFTYIISTQGPVGLLFKSLYPDVYAPDFLGETKYAMQTVLFYVFWTGFGGNLVLLSGALGRISKEMMESANLDGIGMGREIINFVLPLCWPTLSTLLIFNMTGLFQASGPLLLLTKGTAGTMTISYWIFDQVKFQSQIEVPAALGLFFTMIGLPIILVVRHYLNKVYADVEF